MRLALAIGSHATTFFPAWQAHAKKLCQFWTKRIYRQKFVQVAKQASIQEALPPDARDCLDLLKKKMSGSFAKWRWRTLKGVGELLHKLAVGVRPAWDLVLAEKGAFNVKDGESFEAVCAAMSDDTFWGTNRHLVKDITNMIHELRTWGTGCSCHTEELRLHKPVACFWKGRRGREVSARIEHFITEVQDRLRGLSEAELGPEV